MSKYKFIHTDNYGGKIIHVFDQENSDDVTQAFYHFMLGISFSPDSVANSMRSLAEEVDPTEETTPTVMDESDTDEGYRHRRISDE